MILASHGLIASSILQVDADWLAYYNRVIAAGGSLSTTEQNATKTLVADLKANGLWTPMKAIYPMVGASAAACSQNLKSSSFTGTFTATGWTFASTGVTPNGTSAYFDTGLNAASNLTTSNAHLTLYINSFSGSGDRMSGIYPGFFIDQYNSTNVFYGVGASAGDVNATSQLGFFNLNALSFVKLFKNGVSLNSATTGGVLPSLNLFLGAANTTGGPSFYWSGRMSFSSIGDGLTDTQASNFNTAVQAFQTTLSRQV